MTSFKWCAKFLHESFVSLGTNICDATARVVAQGILFQLAASDTGRLLFKAAKRRHAQTVQFVISICLGDAKEGTLKFAEAFCTVKKLKAFGAGKSVNRKMVVHKHYSFQKRTNNRLN